VGVGMAIAAAFLNAASAFAANGTPSNARPNVYFPFASWGAASGPSTTNNDDGCDIGLAPAATLLLPYFEVDFHSPQSSAQTTLFTVINTNHLPAIARVTLWTDYAFPVLDFNIFLTGYGMQSINLYDVIRNGVIPRTSGTIGSSRGALSAGNNGNPNIAESAGMSCLDLPGIIPSTLIADVQSSLTTGFATACGPNRVGGTHANAVGYATIDIVNSCTSTLPNSGTYYASEILFDNWLIGDYQQIRGAGNDAVGNPMVHIRAVPEGGPAGSLPTGVTNLPYTFYARYVLNTGTGALNPPFRDRRQPLPATFAARYIDDVKAAGTDYRIWREGRELVGAPAGYGVGASTAAASCTSVIVNATIPIAEIVRFDEHENITVFIDWFGNPLFFVEGVRLSAASTTSIRSALFPPVSNADDIGGWLYFNLNSGITAGLYRYPDPGLRSSQNWVVVSMYAENRYSVDFDAAWLGNGCSSAPVLNASRGYVFPGPAGQTPVCPVSTTPIGCSPGVAPYIGTNATP
jgi:hypothetical protein